MAGFSPYRTDHLGRLGSFNLDLSRKVMPMEHTFVLIPHTPIPLNYLSQKNDAQDATIEENINVMN